MKYKKVILLLCASLAFFVFSGCALGRGAGSNENDPASVTKGQKIAKVEIRSAVDDSLCKTIESQPELDRFVEKIAFVGRQDVQKDNIDYSKYKPTYNFNVYKLFAAEGSAGFEKIYDLTTYDGANIVKLQVSPETVKNMKLSDDMLTFSCKAPDDAIQYLHSLVS